MSSMFLLFVVAVFSSALLEGFTVLRFYDDTPHTYVAWPSLPTHQVMVRPPVETHTYNELIAIPH